VAAVSAVAIVGVSCSRRPSGTTAERLAILPFENLTGDGSLDWIRSAGAGIVAEELALSVHPAAFLASNVNEAYRRRATQFLHTTYTKRGSAYRFESQLEDADSHKIEPIVTSDGSVLTASTAIARRVSSSAVPFTSQSEKAVEAWGQGDLDAAVQLDPDFGAAWVAFVQKLVKSGRQPDAIKAADTALTRPNLRSDLHKAQLRFSLSNGRGDLQSSLAALNQITQLAPADTGVLFILAEMEIKSRRIDQASAHLRAALATDPSNSDALNTLGYAEAIAGRLDAAKSALETYAKLPTQDVNALDSLGEVHFMNGKFKEAAGYFHQAYSRDPGFLGGATLRKAAFAEWLGGNLTGADATLLPYFKALDARVNGASVMLEASWLFTTGRQDQAIAKLSSIPAAQAEAAKRQLAVWKGQLNPPTDEATLKKAYESVPPTRDGMIRVFYASALASAGKKTEAAELIRRWPLPDDGDPLLQSLVFPRFMQLRQALLGIH
jgi:Flp pilus assembly protein TadD